MNNTTNNSLLSNSTVDYTTYWEACNNSLIYGSMVLFSVGSVLHGYALLYLVTEAKLLRQCMLTFYMGAVIISNQSKLLAELPYSFFLADKDSKFVCHLIVWARHSFGEISSWLLVLMLIEAVFNSRIGTLTRNSSQFVNDQIFWRLILLIAIYSLFFAKNFIVLLFVDCVTDKMGLSGDAWFYFSVQMSDTYVPGICMVILNVVLLYELYQVKYKPLLFSGQARMDKINEVEDYTKVMSLLTLTFVCFTLPHGIYTSQYNSILSPAGIEDSLYYEGVQLVLKLLKLCSFVLYFLCFVPTMKRLSLAKLKQSMLQILKSMLCCHHRQEFDLNAYHRRSNESLELAPVYTLSVQSSSL